MRETIRILHVASFLGNIGDNANHCGFRSSLREKLPFELEFHDLEIRQFYWGELKFDGEFIDLANRYDLVVIGGGNYFELWVENSKSGTSIDLSVSDLKKIKTPILFNALGVDPGQGIPPGNQEKFKKFLDYLLTHEQFLVSVRNDGAIETINSLLGQQYASKVHHVPDAGFAAKSNASLLNQLHANENPLIAINVAGDMIGTRFPKKLSKHCTYNEYLDEMVSTMIGLGEVNQSLEIMFVPHIFRDLRAIADIVDRMPDRLRRTRTKVAPYLTGYEGQRNVLGIYKGSDLTLGTRFHANVCPIGLGTPTIGLSNYRQIDKLYQEIHMENACVKVNEKGFSTNLIEKAICRLDNLDEAQSNSVNKSIEMRKKISHFHEIVADWICSCRLATHNLQ